MKPLPVRSASRFRRLLGVGLWLLPCVAAAQATAAQTTPDAAHADSVVEPVEGRDFVVYEAAGARSSLSRLLEAMDDAEVVLVGEEHGDLVGHAVEAELLRGALDRYRATPRWVVLSLEMFERDVQYVLDEYLTGLITETHFRDSARPWEDYDRRYRPLIETAREHGVPVVAANAPRRYVNLVTREGPGALESLGPLARYYLPPLPFEGPSARYRAQWDSLMAGQEHAAAMGENALQAQALWDVAMGESVVQALEGGPDRLVLHVAGSFHVERGTGIPERIERLRPGTRVLTVVLRNTGSPEEWEAEHAGLGTFVVLTR